MLTGAPPYERDIFRFLLGDPTVQLAPLPAAAAPLEAFVAQALEYAPAGRFQSAAEMRAALADVYLDDLFF